MERRKDFRFPLFTEIYNPSLVEQQIDDPVAKNRSRKSSTQHKKQKGNQARRSRQKRDGNPHRSPHSNRARASLSLYLSTLDNGATKQEQYGIKTGRTKARSETQRESRRQSARVTRNGHHPVRESETKQDDRSSSAATQSARVRRCAPLPSPSLPRRPAAAASKQKFRQIRPTPYRRNWRNAHTPTSYRLTADGCKIPFARSLFRMRNLKSHPLINIHPSTHPLSPSNLASQLSPSCSPNPASRIPISELNK